MQLEEMKSALLGVGAYDGLGFVGGLFLRDGVDPKVVILKGLGIPPVVVSVIGFAMFVLSFIGIITVLKKVYVANRILGLLAVGLAFLSGYMILDATDMGALLLVSAAILGSVAIIISNKNNSQKNSG
jgi:lysylphosphatidylglycerol synthetase-like protein (DUF2156 family)